MALLHSCCLLFGLLQLSTQIYVACPALFDLLAEDVLRFAEDLTVILYLVGQPIVLEFQLYILLLYE